MQQASYVVRGVSLSQADEPKSLFLPKDLPPVDTKPAPFQPMAKPVQAVLLMADTLVIGPDVQSHVQVPDMTQALILYRNRQGLAARWPGNLQINGRSVHERGPLEPGSTLYNEQITLALERVHRKGQA